MPKCKHDYVIVSSVNTTLTATKLLNFFTAVSYLEELVWTPCLMHRCECIWLYILQNYNYKLYFKNLFIYHILHVFMGTLAAENLVGFVADIDIKILGVPPPWAWHAFSR
jgi:hypothetical protein